MQPTAKSVPRHPSVSIRAGQGVARAGQGGPTANWLVHWLFGSFFPNISAFNRKRRGAFEVWAHAPKFSVFFTGKKEA